MRIPARVIPFLALFAASASGQSGPEIIKKVAEKYRTLTSYQFEAQIVTESVDENNESRTRTTWKAAAKLPDRRRLEMAGGPLASVRVYDGEAVWEYRPRHKQFSREEQANYKPPPSVLADPAERYGLLDRSAANAKFLREETIEALGEQRPCWVVEIPPVARANRMTLERSPTTYWVEKTTHLVLKQAETSKLQLPIKDSPVTQSVTTLFTLARVNKPVSDELFRFDPPAEAAQVPKFTDPFGRGTSLVGKPSPDWVLPDLEGKDVTWTSFKGQIVLVTFWATWCVPCREQMKKIEEVQQALEGSGLVVLAINKGETVEIARRYMEEHRYPFRVLLDRDEQVALKFAVSSLPALVLIDREGNISAQFAGYNTSVNLIEELKKIGLQ